MILPLLILIPIIGAIIVALFGAGAPRKVGSLAMAFSVISFIASLCVLNRFISSGMGSDFLMQCQYPFLPQIGASFHLGIDGVSLWLVLLTNLLCPISVWASFN